MGLHNRVVAKYPLHVYLECWAHGVLYGLNFKVWRRYRIPVVGGDFVGGGGAEQGYRRRSARRELRRRECGADIRRGCRRERAAGRVQEFDRAAAGID